MKNDLVQRGKKISSVCAEQNVETIKNLLSGKPKNGWGVWEVHIIDKNFFLKVSLLSLIPFKAIDTDLLSQKHRYLGMRTD